MHMWRSLLLVLLLSASTAGFAGAQEWGAVTGKVVASDTEYPIPGASVVVHGTNFGTATDESGQFSLKLPFGTYALRFSSIGFESKFDSVSVQSGQTTRRTILLVPATIEVGEITVEADQAVEAGVFELSIEDVQNMPTPLPDALRALRVLPGVVVNNELSNQFSVRGGGFNENLFFVNGFEIFLPIRPRTGEQEGLSLVNPDLTERLTLYTGGFPARYGGKLSSAVDASYRKPQRTGEGLRVSAFTSLLDMGFSAGSSQKQGRLGWLIGARKARARHFFASQELKGEYRPDYTDVQGYLGYVLARGHEVEILGMAAENEFRLDPSARKTFFGTLSQNEALAPSNLQSLWIRFDGDNEELDAYSTRFVGLRLSDRFSPVIRAEHDVSMYETTESERLDLSGTAILYQVDPTSDNPEDGEGLFPTGSSRQEDYANNKIAATTLTANGRWFWTGPRHVMEGGYGVRSLSFDDQLSEKSVVVGRATNGDVVRIVADSLNDGATLSSWQSFAYLQDSIDLLAEQPGKMTITAGIRGDYYAFTDEWTLSPRASFSYEYSPTVSYFASAGVYHQAPTYRELRGKPEVGQTILGSLNSNLASQRSLQFVVGAEIFLPSRRFYIRGESYVKDISNLISYDIENVRVLYSGENDAEGLMYGLDLQLRGELVPGMESWLNYSFLKATETFTSAFETPRNSGTIARPTDQRHTVSLFIQDYIPSDPSWKLHLRTLYGSGLPYTPPVPGEQIGNLLNQIPGDRFSARYTRFFRFDMGASKVITPLQSESDLEITLTAEILNLFDMVNTVSYSWIPDASGIWQRIPTRLTPRTVNVRLAVRF